MHGQIHRRDAPRSPFWPILSYFYSLLTLFIHFTTFAKNKAIYHFLINFEKRPYKMVT